MLMNINISLIKDFYFVKPINFWCKVYIIIQLFVMDWKKGSNGTAAKKKNGTTTKNVGLGGKFSC